MHKSNPERNGQEHQVTEISGINGIKWKAEGILLASADKKVVCREEQLYCVGTVDGSFDANFLAVDTSDGKVAWSLNTGVRGVERDQEVFSSPTLADYLAYFLYKPIFSRNKPTLYGVNLISKEIEFKTDINAEMGDNYVDGTVHEYRRWLRTSTLIVKDNIYVGTGNGYICSFDRKTGKINGAIQLSGDHAVGHIAYSEGYLYAQSGNRDLYSVSISLKSVAWKFEHPEEHKTFLNWYDLCPLVFGDKVYVFGSLKKIYAVQKSSGKLIWSYGTDGVTNNCMNFVSDGESVIGLMRNDSLQALDLESGDRVWSKKIGAPILSKSSPVVVGSTLLISSGGYLYGMNSRTGDVLFRWEIPLSIEELRSPVYMAVQLANAFGKVFSGSPGLSLISSPCVTKKAIYVSTENATDSSLYCLKV
ncbi:PQQ-binding-like beta-propeller repeat protein [cf. Phormidesmis sp. LEGE 11477]|uniref:outer membrane protein assembly factor BamB family protein n=1 Tax=cf. Phormidesmis sp. LEGE 11477 TaxID=1828680 RepID=UPI001880EC41|nr:PQQ-binding-like beta-propeller repeat protein [cf. Phormidesmis sp. LEGE 11477]MBE9064428.1 PQQ-binding-like beta-propeller repeat protein [cf. Phormidesmis sp. LEGE 11477]